MLTKLILILFVKIAEDDLLYICIYNRFHYINIMRNMNIKGWQDNYRRMEKLDIKYKKRKINDSALQKQFATLTSISFHAVKIALLWDEWKTKWIDWLTMTVDRQNVFLWLLSAKKQIFVSIYPERCMGLMLWAFSLFLYVLSAFFDPLFIWIEK